MKKEILKLTGLTEDQFYKMYPTEAAFKAAYPNFKLGGTPEAFPQIATADNFFSYGVPVPPTIHAYGGPVYPQIQTEAQFFSPVYSNTNNAYAVGGSYMEAYPQAKVYPQGPVGGSAFYTMQDGGSSMPEPTKDQTFYTQKMNDFFEKLRQASYKNMISGMINTEEDVSYDGMKQLSVGKYGGMPSFQPGGGIPANNFIEPNRSAELFGDTGDPTTSYRTVTSADGQTFIVGPNNQLYSPFKGNQTAASTQQQGVNYYPYLNNRGMYIGTGLDNVANWLIPNNQRERYRNIREQKGLGLGDLTPQQLEAIKSGTANISELNYETRRALFPRNRVKSVNIKFDRPGQAAASTTQTQAPLLMPGQKAFDPTVKTQQQQQQTQQQPTSTTTTTTQAAPVVPVQSTQDVNATVAKMQADAKAKGMTSPYFYNPESDEDLMPAEERMKLQQEQDAIAAEFKNYENYKKYRDIQQRMKGTADEYDYNKVYDYSTVQATNPGAIALPASPTTTKISKAPSNTKSMDPNVAKKKAGMKNPNTYINQDYIDAVRNQARGTKGMPAVNIQAPADTIDTTTWPGVYSKPGTPKFSGEFPDGEDNLPFRMGGPYALPMYQGMTGPSQVPFQAPWQHTLDLINQANYKLNDKEKSEYVGPEQFELGFDVGRTKKKGVNPYGSSMIRGAAGLIDKYGDRANAREYMNEMLAADKVFSQFDQDRGDYDKNTGLFKLDQTVAYAQQGGPLIYDVADLFFLTPQMLKNTRSRR